MKPLNFHNFRKEMLVALLVGYLSWGLVSLIFRPPSFTGAATPDPFYSPFWMLGGIGFAALYLFFREILASSIENQTSREGE